MRKIGTRYTIADLKLIVVHRVDVGVNTELNIKDNEEILCVYKPINKFAEHILVGKINEEDEQR